MKISLNALASVEKTETVNFMNMTDISYQQIEKFISGQFNKFNLLRAKVYRAQDMGKLEKKEFEEIVSFCNENIRKCEEIADKFELFKVSYSPKRTYANFNHLLNNLLEKDDE